MKNLISKYGSAIAAFSLLVVSMQVGIICIAIFHQPELPEGAKSLRKF